MLEKVEETARVARHIIIVLPGLARIRFCKSLLRVFPVYFCALGQVRLDCSITYGEILLTDATTSRSQEKSSMESVMPSASGVSPAAAGGAIYLYSFFKTLSLKYGFSLKC
jgi:hypothetical protein